MIVNEDTKRELAETIELLKQLDKNSLILIKNGAELLRAREILDDEDFAK